MNILIADDHSVVRTGLKYVLESLAEHVTVFEAEDFYSAQEIVKQHSDLDLIILDLSMPGIVNLSAITEIRRATPATPIVIFSAAEDQDTVRETIKMGAQGFIQKSSPRDVVIAALHKILAGDIVVPDSLSSLGKNLESEENWNLRDPAKRELTLDKTVLTRRQREVLLLLVQGESNNDIAEHLHLSLATIKTHIANVFQALEVSNRSQAVYKARKMGLIRKENASSAG